MYAPTRNDSPINTVDPPVRGEAASLIARYPNLSESELARLINIYPRVPAVEAALMISDEKLGPNLDRFFADHRSSLRTPFRQYAALVVIAVAGILVASWAVVAGS